MDGIPFKRVETVGNVQFGPRVPLIPEVRPKRIHLFNEMFQACKAARENLINRGEDGVIITILDDVIGRFEKL